MMWRPTLTLRRYLGTLLSLATLITLLIVGGGLLVVRLPELEHLNAMLAQHEVQDFATRERTLLEATEQRMRTLAHALEMLPPDKAQRLMDAEARMDPGMGALVLTDSQGRVRAVATAPATGRSSASEIIGADLSGSPLWAAFVRRGERTWSTKYLSLLSGRETVGLATPLDDGRVLITELPLSSLLQDMHVTESPTSRDVSYGAHLWIVDSHGEVLADSQDARNVGKLNLGKTLMLEPMAPGRETVRWTAPDGRGYHMSSVHSQELDWYFIARVPAGWHNDVVRNTVVMLGSAFLGTLLVGLMLAPVWTRGLARHVALIIERSKLIGHTTPETEWPKGAVRELDQLAEILQDMARRLDGRERERAAIFNTAPIPMLVMDMDSDFHIVDANQSWLRLHGFEAEAVIGNSPHALGLWSREVDRQHALKQVASGRLDMECELNTQSAGALLCRITARAAQVQGRHLLIWANEDVSALRASEKALQELNQTLERRVEERTASFEQANAALRQTLVRLDETRDTLVRSEKMAALGSLVAGVAHELNTPLGNGLMATSTLQSEASQFVDEMRNGLRRSSLDRLLTQVTQATQITQRNLERALELVTSFKQVAVDQASSQRRRFGLHEVVREIALTLKPSVGRTPHQLSTDVASDIVMDSYPGALGQILTNLVSNALVHAFPEHHPRPGAIRIEVDRRSADVVLMRVHDDGVGIASDLLPRIFDPFVTTRMGRGGTGLGLNIAYNLATGVLGGELRAVSAPGSGTTFELVLPCRAPQPGATHALVTPGAVPGSCG